jgi:hypothetical protein
MNCQCGCGGQTKKNNRFLHGHNGKGKKQSIESINKRVESRNNPKPKTQRISRSQAHLGLRHSDETKKKISASLSGKKRKPLTESHKKAISYAGLGRKRSPEAIAKTVAFHTGRKRSLETRKKLSEKAKLRPPISDQERKKRSERMKGRKRSKEELLKASISIKKAYREGRKSVERTCGVTGYYKSLRFSSTPELAFLTNLLNLEDLIRADSIGKIEYRIPYITENGESKTYHPDYFDVKTFTLYEIKHVGYKRSQYLNTNVNSKIKAAEGFCKERAWKYELIEMPCLDKQKIIYPMRLSGQISLSPYWELKYQTWLSQNQTKCC